MLFSRTFPALAAAVALSTAAGWGLANLGAAQPLAAAAQESEAPESASDIVIEDMQLGNPDADVTVIEYASFTCPHCRNFHDTVFEELKENYIDTGEINFVYREVYFPRDTPSLWAGMVARCGGEDRYFGIVDLLYDQQQEWVQGDGEQISANLRRIGRVAGLTEEQLNSCLSDREMAVAMARTSQENREADDISATPSFVINGTTYSNMSYEEFSSILDEELAE